MIAANQERVLRTTTKRRRILDDEDFFTFTWGKFKGTRIQKVPASYIIWLVEVNKTKEPKVLEYYASNMDVLTAEADQEKTQFLNRNKSWRYSEED